MRAHQHAQNATFGLFAASLFRLTGWFHIDLFLFIYGVNTNQQIFLSVVVDVTTARTKEFQDNASRNKTISLKKRIQKSVPPEIPGWARVYRILRNNVCKTHFSTLYYMTNHFHSYMYHATLQLFLAEQYTKEHVDLKRYF